MKRLLVALTGLAALAGCAPSPDAIAAAAVPAGLYDRMSCSAALAAQAQVRADLAGLEADQRQAVTGDAVGVFLFAVPMSSLTGGDKAGLIGDAKGRALALEARLARC